MLGRIRFYLMLAALLPLRVSATDYTDIWWNPAESGQGYNLAQNGDFIFATFFVYGSQTAPTWYTAQLLLDGAGKFSGSVFATTGPWFGTVPFDPARVTVSQVGNATFQPTAADKGVLTYAVGPVEVVKNIQRQNLVPVQLAGNYTGAITLNDAGCANPADNGPVDVPATLQVTQGPSGQIQIVADFMGIASCTFANTGPVAQTGALITFQGTYTCSDGSVTPITVYELKATSLGIEGRWTSPNAAGCREDARFGGVVKY